MSLTVPLATQTSASVLGAPAGRAWTAPGHAFVTEAVVAEVNGDGTPDVVVASGDRLVYSGFTPGNPAWVAWLAADSASRLPAQLKALDGKTGAVLWVVTWGEGGPGTPARPVHVLEDMFTADVTGNGADEIVVLYTTYLPLAETVTQHTAVYDPRAKTLLHDEARVVDRPAGATLRRSIDAREHGGATWMAVTTWLNHGGGAYSAWVELARFGPDGKPAVISTTAAQDGMTRPRLYESGEELRLVTVTYYGQDRPSLARISSGVVERDGDGFAVRQMWSRLSRPSVGSRTPVMPVVVTGGSEPKLVTGEHSLEAFDLQTGATIWSSASAPVAGGTGDLLAHDANGDGVEDLIVASGPVSLTPAADTYATAVRAIDGRTGALLWETVEETAEMHVIAVAEADVDADGSPELVTSGIHQDGFTDRSSRDNDPGMVGVYDMSSGARLCRTPLERTSWSPVAANLDGLPGDEFVAPTVGGSVHAFLVATPHCIES